MELWLTGVFVPDLEITLSQLEYIVLQDQCQGTVLEPSNPHCPLCHQHDLPAHAHGSDLIMLAVHLDVQYAGAVDLRTLLADDGGGRLGHLHGAMVDQVGAQRAVGAARGRVLRHPKQRGEQTYVDGSVRAFRLKGKDHYTLGAQLPADPVKGGGIELVSREGLHLGQGADRYHELRHPCRHRLIILKKMVFP
jgi:hypothetical protein